MPSSQVNMFEAKSQLSRLVEAVESGAMAEIVIARNGKPAARLVPVQDPRPGIRLGLLAGRFSAPSLEGLDADNELIAAAFLGDGFSR
ncbi:MAG: prevent-host-death protein [Rhizobiales bacterium PAR1]|nr:MAG: prevent-host-death protein [Rhizobiales bacterium PAR1]